MNAFLTISAKKQRSKPQNCLQKFAKSSIFCKKLKKPAKNRRLPAIIERVDSQWITCQKPNRKGVKHLVISS
jgi:hypothetical protein